MSSPQPKHKIQIAIMRDGNIWALAFVDQHGPSCRISNRKGSGSWQTVATLDCEFTSAELLAHQIKGAV